MPFFLISQCDRRLSLQPGTARPLGRADVGKCPESMFVSRQQCLISVSADGSQVQLQHTGSGNPTLVIRAGDQQQQQLLKQGEAVQLSAGDALALVATRPTDVLRLVEESGGDNQQQQQQQQLQPLRSARAGPVVAAAAVSGREGGLNPAQRPAASAAAGTAAGGTAPADGAAAGTSAAGAAAAGAAAAAAGGSAPAVQPHPANPVMLLLVGIPGSGKSTFATSLARASGRSWARVNQDSIRRGGKPGSRAQCVNAARRALAAGHNVVIDRCNLEPSQRTDFLALAAAAAAPVHCLFINLPTGLCVKRAAGRRDHEGGVDGPGAARVVNRMAASLKKADRISAAQEGFSSVTTAVNDQQVAAALQHWAAAAVSIAATEAAAEQQQQQPAAAAAADEVCVAEPPAKRARSDSPTPAAAAAATAGAPQRPRQQQQQQSKVQPGGSTPAKQGTPAAAAAGGSAASPGRSAFAVLMAGAKQKQQQQSAKSPKGGTLARGAPPAPTTAAAAAGRTAAGSGGVGGGGGPALGWSSALAQIAADPERFRGQASIWHVDDQVVGLLDKFPKSTLHGLLVARQPGLDSVDMLGRGGGQQQQQHLALLAHMREVALTWIHQQQQQQQQSGQQEAGSSGADNSSSSSSSSIPPGWRVGFHSIPSMAQLHLHILSNDFVSPWLKTKKHWNSFTSPFFLHLDDVVAELQRTGGVRVDRAEAEALLKGPLVCHKCAAGVQLPNMPQLKAHLLTHVL